MNYMGIITLEEALALLKPVLADLRACVREAWKKYEASVPALVPLASSGFRAHAMHEFVLEEVRHRIGGQYADADIAERSRRRRFLVYWKKRLALQFKKLGPDFLTRNYPTRTAVDFDRQVLDLPECKPYPKLTIGYQLDEFATGLLGVYVAFRIGKECVWWHNLDTGEESIMFDFPTPDTLSPDVGDEEVMGDDVDEEERGSGA
jgi:hypothetical protein